MDRGIKNRVSIGAGLCAYLLSFHYNPHVNDPKPQYQSSFLSESKAESKDEFVGPLQEQLIQNAQAKSTSKQVHPLIGRSSIDQNQTTAQTTKLVRCFEEKTKAVIGEFENQTLLLFSEGAIIPDAFNRLYTVSLLSGSSNYFVLNESDSGLTLYPGTSGSFASSDLMSLPIRAVANYIQSLVKSPYVDNEEESNWRTSWSECLSYATTSLEAARPLHENKPTPSATTTPTEPQIYRIPDNQMPPMPRPKYVSHANKRKSGSLTINPTINIYGKKQPKGNSPADYKKLQRTLSSISFIPYPSLETRIDPELAICAATNEEQDNVVEFLTTTTNYFSKNPYAAVEEIESIKESCSDILRDYDINQTSNESPLSAAIALSTPPKSDNYVTINPNSYLMSLRDDN